MKAMNYKGYFAKVEFDPEDHIFVGHIIGIQDVIGFHGESVKELEAAFKEALSRKELSKEDGIVYKRMSDLGEKLMNGIEEIFSQNNIPVVVQGPGPFFSSFFTNKPINSYRDTFGLDTARYSKFWLALVDYGIRIWTSARGQWYLSAAHTEEDIQTTLDAIGKVAKNLKS